MVYFAYKRIAELRGLDDASQQLAERIAKLAANYDTQGIAAAIRKAPVLDG